MPDIGKKCAQCRLTECCCDTDVRIKRASPRVQAPATLFQVVKILFKDSLTAVLPCSMTQHSNGVGPLILWSMPSLRAYMVLNEGVAKECSIYFAICAPGRLDRLASRYCRKDRWNP